MARQRKTTPKTTTDAPGERLRMQVISSYEQGELLAAAAAAAGADRSTWMLAHALKAAGAADTEHAPMVLDAATSDRLREAAKRQGVDPKRLLDQFLITA